MSYPSKQPGYDPNAGTALTNPSVAAEENARRAQAGQPPLPTPQIGDTLPPGSVPPAPVSPAPQGGDHANNSMPEGTGQPASAPEGAPPGTGTPAPTEAKTVEEAEAVEGITDIAEANEIIRKLRDENARRRVANADINQVMADASPEQRANMLNFLHQLRTDPIGSRARLQSMIEEIDAVAEATAEAEEAGQEYLTAADLERKRAEWEREALITSYETRARDLGYDPSSPDYGKLLAVASREFGGQPDPIGQAHEKIVAEIAAIEAAAVERYRAEVQGIQPHTVPTRAGSPAAADPVLPEGADQPGEKPTWGGARAKARARLAGVQAAQNNNPMS